MTLREKLVEVYGELELLEPEYLDDAIVAVHDDGSVLYSEDKIIRLTVDNEQVGYSEGVMIATELISFIFEQDSKISIDCEP